LAVSKLSSSESHRALAQAAAKAAFADRLKAAIEQKGWSLGQTARQVSRFLDGETKFGPAHVWHYLQGKVLPRRQYLAAISRALGLPPEELVPPVPLARATDSGVCEARSTSRAATPDEPIDGGRDGSDGLAAARPAAVAPSRPAIQIKVVERPPDRRGSDHRPLVVLLTGDRLAGLRVENNFRIYRFDVALAETPDDALRQLQSRRSAILVADLDWNRSACLALVQSARKFNPMLPVICTAASPERLWSGERIAGAPSLRTPYHPHQLLNLVRQLLRRTGSDEDPAHPA
jgi:transcriptional regulator with XRE-family HTH domain